MEFKVPFSYHTDASVGTVEDLTAKVKLMITSESRRTSPPPPPSPP